MDCVSVHSRFQSAASDCWLDSHFLASVVFFGLKINRSPELYTQGKVKWSSDSARSTPPSNTWWLYTYLFLWSPFITVTKVFSAKECTLYCPFSRAADTVILWCQLSQDVNTWPLPVSAHQATHSLYECLCAQKPLRRRSHVRHTMAQPIIHGWGWQGKGMWGNQKGDKKLDKGERNEKQIKHSVR